MADKVAQLEDPQVVRLYQLIGRIAAATARTRSCCSETADLMSELFEQAAASGELDRQDDQHGRRAFVGCWTRSPSATPCVARLRELIAERGWTGWTKIARA